jgi:hypothetical protein
VVEWDSPVLSYTVTAAVDAMLLVVLCSALLCTPDIVSGFVFNVYRM